jgi:hypothetical protein
MKSKFLKSITTISIVASIFAMTITSQAVAEVDKSQPIQVLSPYDITGGTHGLGETIIDYLEKQGWTNINNGNGFQSTGGCANLINIREKSNGPVFWLQNTLEIKHPEDHPCYVDEVSEKDFVTLHGGWSDFICRRKDLNLPPIDKATGTVRIAVDVKERFGEVEEEILRAMAPNANIILMRYGASGGALKALQAKEVQYTWSTLFDGERSENMLKCDYNTSDLVTRGTAPIKKAFPEIDFTDAKIDFQGANYEWWNADNASEDLKAAFAKDWIGAFKNHEPTIKALDVRGYLEPVPTDELEKGFMKDKVGSKWKAN